MTFQHSSGIPGANDRGPSNPDWQSLVFSGGNFTQPSEFNELQTHFRRQLAGVGNMVAAAGDRLRGGGVVVVPNDPDTTATVRLDEGEVYLDGLRLSVPARDIFAVPTSGEISIGVWKTTTWITHETDPDLLGIDEGTQSFGEPGAGRERVELQWGLSTDAIPVAAYAQVYLMRDGTVLDQAPPPALTGILQQIAVYDSEANGHYITDGCQVVPLGKVGSDQIFSIAAGSANIQGWKRKRESALRFAVTEEPDLESVVAEQHLWSDTAGSTEISVNRPPINAVTRALITKEITETVYRGTTPGGADNLSQPSVSEILEVIQGSAFDPSEYELVGNQISWAPAGNEPAQASSYSVRYLYLDEVAPDAVTDTLVTLSGGVDGHPVLLDYTSKLPRIDLIGLEPSGAAVHVKGVAARDGALPPKPPTSVLKLAEVHNTWTGTPTVRSNGTPNFPFDTTALLWDFVERLAQQLDRDRAERDVQSRDAVSADGIFTDPFQDAFYRDAGAPQTLAFNQGVLQLAIDIVDVQALNDQVSLDYSEEVIVSQTLASRPMKINPYMNFTTMPGALSLSPPTDFWVDHVTEEIAGLTQEMVAAPGRPPGTQVFNNQVSESSEAATTLRRITITYTIEGFSANEELSSLTFDGIDITPAGPLTADLNGEIAGSFQIPEAVPTGSRLVRADGAAGSFAEALFVGEGTIETSVVQRVTLVTRAAPPPIINVITQVTNVVARGRAGQQGNQGQGDGGMDPLAQTFALTEGRHVTGIDVRLAVLGDPNNGIRIQLCTTLNGYPTNEILAEDFISMQGRSVGDVLTATFGAPVWLNPFTEYAFVAMTDDADHALFIARLGDVDPDTGQLISAQPYTVGIMFSSANRTSWTPHQDDDLWFQIKGAVFDPVEKTQDLFTGTLNEFSDLLVRGAIERPTADTTCRFELVRANGQIVPFAEGQNIAFDQLINEVVTIRAVVAGTRTASPIVWPGATIVAGKIRTVGEYVTKSWPINGVLKAVVLFAQVLPPGAGITVEMDKLDDVWVPLSVTGARALGGGWTEPVYEVSPHEAPNGGRLKITMTGGAGARPSIASLRAYGI